MQGTFSPFHSFSISHLAALGLIVAVAAALVVLARCAGSDGAKRRVAILLALALVLNKVAVYCTIFAIEDQSWTHALPMHMCDWAAVSAIIALLWRRQLPYELAYFWGLGGTLQATLTPDLKYDFPDIRFLTFFISHGGTLVAVAFLTLGLGMRPWPKSLLRILLWSNIYLLAAGTVDWLVDDNYGYLRHKPLHASLLDHMGPWPWYIVSLEAAAMVSFVVYYIPFFVMDRVGLTAEPQGRGEKT
jgi:hypothetical integral membrane protein (TIGR02206 family)